MSRRINRPCNLDCGGTSEWVLSGGKTRSGLNNNEYPAWSTLGLESAGFDSGSVGGLLKLDPNSKPFSPKTAEEAEEETSRTLLAPLLLGLEPTCEFF
jgi:hypothetical protein